MEKKLKITIQNLFNGDLTTYINQEKAQDYITLCIQRQIPITINYIYSYVN